MAKAKLEFSKLISDSMEYGSDDEHMVSRVFFSISLEGEIYENVYADLKQLVGGDVEKSPIEVSKPYGYTGPFNHEQFRQIVENYYRGLIGANGMGIKISGDSTVRMRNSTFNAPALAEIDVNNKSGTW